jgi:long-chain acyl-CoA synthetase
MKEYAVPPVTRVDDSATLTDAVWDNATQRPDAVQFVRDASAGSDLVSCARFRDEVLTLARGLAAAGVATGSRVGLMSRTRYEWTLADYAILACGAVTVPIYDTASEEQVAWTLSDSGASGCVVDSAEHAALVAGATGGGSMPVWSIDAGDLDRLEPAGVPVEEIEARRRSVAADDIATIVYTSGTTGRPKGCVLTHRNILTDVGNAVAVLHPLFETEDAATLLFLPLAHSFARLVQFGCVAAGTTLRHVPDPKDLAAELEEFRPTFVLAIPRVFEKVHDGARAQAAGRVRRTLFTWAASTARAYSRAQDSGGPPAALRWRHRLFDRLVYRRIRQRLGGRCRYAISGGAPLRPDLAHFFRGVGLTVLEGYGLTETSPAVSANVPEAVRIGTVGRPLPGVAVRIADDGEVMVRGDVVFSGYWNNPDATADITRGDGWLLTGDLGSLDEDGYLTITGRKKEIIVTASGKNVSPAALEDRLSSHPLISRSMLVGDRRPFVAALIAIDEQAWPQWLAEHDKPADATVAAMRDDPDLVDELRVAVAEANRAVSRGEAIKQFRILPKDLSEQRGELTPTMKVKRGVVQEEYANEIDAIYRG